MTVGNRRRLESSALYGRALLDYHRGATDASLGLRSSLGEADVLPVSLFFRSEEELMPFEEALLEQARGRTLDVGAGTGVHALLLGARGLEVTAIDVCAEAVLVARERGVTEAHHADVRTFDGGRFDTVLSVMNGTGPAGRLAALPSFLDALGRHLAPGGRILVDSAAPPNRFAPPGPEESWPSTPPAHPGDAWIELEYGGELGHPFRELYVDLDSFLAIGRRSGWRGQAVFIGEEGSWAAVLVRA